MKFAQPIVVILCFLLVVSCKTKPKYPYAIGDFKSSLQPYLVDIVNHGIFPYADSSLKYLDKNVTEKELQMLSLADNPQLRVTALTMRLYKSETNDFDIVMAHLDDTALIPVNQGEFGIYYYYVTDYILPQARWKSLEEKYKVIDKVILNHNYLKSAYTILADIEPDEKYYSIVKKMALADKDFETIELALYGLAGYRKPADIEFIKQILFKRGNFSEMGPISFSLMKEYPNNAYLEILETYGRKGLFRKHWSEKFYRIEERYLETVALYKNDKSATILQSILDSTSFATLPPTYDYFKDALLKSIWLNRCPAYSKLTRQIEPIIPSWLKSEPILVDAKHIPKQIDTTNWSRYWANTIPQPQNPY